MGVEEAWGMDFTGAGVNIAILDVGVEMNHTDLKPNIVCIMENIFCD